MAVLMVLVVVLAGVVVMAVVVVVGVLPCQGAMVAVTSAMDHYKLRLSLLKIVLEDDAVAEAERLLAQGRATLFEAQVLQSFSKLEESALAGAMATHNEQAAARAVKVDLLHPAVWIKLQSYI